MLQLVTHLRRGSSCLMSLCTVPCPFVLVVHVLPDFSGHVLPGQQPRQMTASIFALGTLLGVGGLLGVRARP